MPTYVPLSLTETYCPSWGTWEGVRELVQNAHDGALEGGGHSWRRTPDGSFACHADSGKICATIAHANDRLVLVNHAVGLTRKALLLGASQKADSTLAIGQFGEGMKVGALALLREGRQVEMATRGELWRWCRREDAAFGVRVLTVEVSERADAAGILLLDGDADADDPAKAAAPPADAAEDDTVVVVGPISTAEWATYATRFLFLTPATDAFRSVELGELLLDESLRGQLCEPHAAAQTLTFFPACAC